MKNIIFVLAIALFMLIANFIKASETLTGNSLTKAGTYALTQSSNSLVINDVAYKTWELSYSDDPVTYQVFLIPGPDGNCCYTVRGEGFEIRYALESGDFGAKLVEQPYKTVPRKELMSKLNKTNLLTQEVISTTPKSEEEYLGLIACFMPLLKN
jgi:hypothetical protein